MSLPFYLVYAALMWVADVTGLSYEMINIIVYFVIIPTIFFALIDKILRRPICLLVYYAVLVFLLLMVRDWDALAEAVFAYAVQFLLLFGAIGINYDRASVIMCIVVPILVFLVLVYLAFPKFFHRYLPMFARLLAPFRRKTEAGR